MAQPTTLQHLLDLALQHHQAGRLREAERIYRQILAERPEQADAMHYLGVIALQSGRTEIAIELIRRAIAIKPDYAEAHNNLGNILAGNGRFDEAIAAYRQAIALRPNYVEAHNNLGNALAGKEQTDQAIASYRQAIALNPSYAKAHSNLGNVLAGKGQLDEAIASCRQAIAIRANYAEAYNNLGNALADKGQLDEAIAVYRQAIALKPSLPEAHNSLGNALRDKGQLDEAIAASRQAIALKPGYAEAYNNLGTTLARKGQCDEAIAAYRQAIALKPEYADAHFNLAASLLAREDFQQGWEEYEWRLKRKELPFLRDSAQRQWDGSSLEGRSLLLHAEQGFGDALQFIRYLPRVAQRGGRIILGCQPELQRLFQTIADGCQIVVRGQALPAFDLYCPLLSLPRVFGTTLASIPNLIPYLRADAGEAGKWQQRLAEHCSMVKVGLAWAGSPAHKNDRNRSMKLARLAPLGRTPGVRFFSLQKGEAAAESKTPPGLELVDWTQELKDFADTAGLIENLDLVIAVDTAVAHLAGAMGKPVWTLLPSNSDWRWMLEREDSPWYPTMRLFRQTSWGDWDSVVARVAEALSLWIRNRA